MLRSVDSEDVGRVIEPRNLLLVGADAVPLAEGNIADAERPGVPVPPGSESRACIERI